MLWKFLPLPSHRAVAHTVTENHTSTEAGWWTTLVQQWCQNLQVAAPQNALDTAVAATPSPALPPTAALSNASVAPVPVVAQATRRYVVSLGAFKDTAKAHQLANRVTADGYSATVEQRGALQRVVVRVILTEDSFPLLLEQLRQRYNPQAFVVR
jgi:cell division septation protein DedD